MYKSLSKYGTVGTATYDYTLTYIAVAIPWYQPIEYCKSKTLLHALQAILE